MAGDTSPAQPVSRRSRILIGAALMIGLVGGWKGFVAGGSSGPGQAASGESVTTTTHPGPVVTLEPFTINIGGGRYLKVGLGLQLAGDVEEAEPTNDDDPTKGYAPAVDLAIETLTNGDADQLGAPSGRSEMKARLLERLREVYGEEVEEVYFTRFVFS